MSLYIRVQTSYWNHRKTCRLKSALGEDALWLPLRLWSYAAEYRPDGDFTEYSAEDIKSVLAYSGDATDMLQALQQSGFMDEMKIHDWDEHNAFHATYSDRARKAAKTRWKKEKNQKKEENQSTEKEIQSKHDLSIAKHASSIPCKLLELNGFEAEWNGFEEMRRKKRAPMTAHAARLILLKLSEHPNRAVVALRTAITRNWTGFEWDWMNSRNGSRREDKPAKVDPSKIDLPERFKAWAASAYPDKREDVMKWQTWADVPSSLRQEWWREEKDKLPVDI